MREEVATAQQVARDWGSRVVVAKAARRRADDVASSGDGVVAIKGKGKSAGKGSGGRGVRVGSGMLRPDAEAPPGSLPTEALSTDAAKVFLPPIYGCFWHEVGIFNTLT